MIIVGIGGILGGLCRFKMGELISRKSDSSFPLGIFTINITGAFLLGVLTGFNPSGSTYLLLGDGFLGAFTTFSTFMYDGFNLLHDNKRLSAFIYIFGSIAIGIIGYIAGYSFIRLFK